MTDMKHTIKIADKPVHLKMTFGLLNEICRIAGDGDAALLLNMDQDLRDATIKALLSERDEEGLITKDVNLFSLDATPEDIVGMLDWAGGHVLDFFLTATEKARDLGKRNEARLAVLQSTLTGGKP